jgi:hypothetical protein
LRSIVFQKKDLKVIQLAKMKSFMLCYSALLSEFSDCKPEAEVIPWGDGKNRVTVFLLGGIIGDQQEAD